MVHLLKGQIVQSTLTHAAALDIMTSHHSEQVQKVHFILFATAKGPFAKGGGVLVITSVRKQCDGAWLPP